MPSLVALVFLEVASTFQGMLRLVRHHDHGNLNVSGDMELRGDLDVDDIDAVFITTDGLEVQTSGFINNLSEILLRQPVVLSKGCLLLKQLVFMPILFLVILMNYMPTI